ncbi:MAG: efflux RND transporter periplasmic adaptor subunit [Rhodobacteraceae bacterium]|nr:efflux RND transporter periplasmic adaptor subunit [Paracoccaceae bacterium]
MRLLPVLAAVWAVSAGPILAQEVLKPVKLLAVSEEAHKLERKFYGQVVAKRSVDLAFQVGGQILDFPVTEGFTVPKGGLIAQLDLEPFELQFNQAKLQKEQADRTVTRLKRLEGTVSQVSIDDAETQAGLTQIALRNAEYELEHASLEAPFDALVSNRNVELFTTVSAGTPIVRLHDMSELHIEVEVPEILFQRAENDPATQIFAQFPGKAGEFPVQILEFDAEASNVAQTFRITFAMERPEGLNVFPGSSATITVAAEVGEAGIFVPAGAIVTDPSGQTGVMVFDPTGADDGTVTWVAVTLEPSDQGQFKVTQGLSDGQEIVLTGGAALDDGQAVRRFTGFAN